MIHEPIRLIYPKPPHWPVEREPHTQGVTEIGGAERYKGMCRLIGGPNGGRRTPNARYRPHAARVNGEYASFAPTRGMMIVWADWQEPNGVPHTAEGVIPRSDPRVTIGHVTAVNLTCVEWSLTSWYQGSGVWLGEPIDEMWHGIIAAARKKCCVRFCRSTFWMIKPQGVLHAR